MKNHENSFAGKELLETDSTSISKLYKELNNAINTNNVQSIWELSKTITRYHFRNSEL
jgi:hypothetical protein